MSWSDNVVLGDIVQTRQQQPWTRTRIPSVRMRELATFLIKNEDITLLNAIGEGVK